ncbi:hypothetical protein SDC9_142608 [bioreactor metagenome]|uniref:Uncharacterized protein n=1 Tax=bioreactor metagenome TaxID=1076179 RepID=A0A645E0Z0_9ZZZZ
MSALAAAIGENPFPVDARIQFQCFAEGVERVENLHEAGIVGNVPSEAAHRVEIISALAIFGRNADQIQGIGGELHFILMLKAVSAPAVTEQHDAGILVRFVRRDDQRRDRFRIGFRVDGMKCELEPFHFSSSRTRIAFSRATFWNTVSEMSPVLRRSRRNSARGRRVGIVG